MPSYADEVLADLPNVYYKMHEASGVLLDSSGNGRNGATVFGSPTYQIVGPITSESPNYGIQSSGSSYFDSADHALFDLGDGPFTLEGWVKRGAGQGTLQTMMVKGLQYQLAFQSDNTIILAENGVAVVVPSTITITDTTTWHHVVVTKTGATSKVYIDGVDRTGTVTDSPMANSAIPFYVGAGNGGGEYLSSGHQIAQFAVYPSVLSAARVLAHFNAAAAASGIGVPRVHPASKFGPF